MNDCMLMTGFSSPVLLRSLGAFEILVLAMAVPVSVALFLFADRIVSRVIVFGLAVCVIYGAEKWWSSPEQPQSTASQALAQGKEATAEIATPLAIQQAREAANFGAAGAVLVAAGLCFGRYLRSGLGKLRFQKVQMAA